MGHESFGENVGKKAGLKFGRAVLQSVLAFGIAAQGPMALAAAGPQTDKVTTDKVTTDKVTTDKVTTDKVTTDKVTKDVVTQFNRQAGTKAAFCYAVEDGPIMGHNQDELMRSASVTKTLTTFWAIEKLGPDFQYKTHIFYQPSTHEMHIQGQRDPFFDRDRLYTLLADMNRKGVTTISRLTVDSNFWLWPDATEIRYMQDGGGGGRGKSRSHRSSHGGYLSSRGRHHAMNIVSTEGRAPAGYSFGNINFKHFVEAESHTDKTLAGDPERISAYLKSGFNTDTWSSWMKERYQKSRSLNPSLSLPASVKMKTDSIDFLRTENNPLKGKPGVYEFIVKSAPIRNYLKMMNIWSINPYAEEIFFSLGGKPAFQAFMQAKLGFGSKVSDVNTGSGVNMHGDKRNDSMVSCSTVVSMIRLMDQDLEKKGLDLADVLSVPGNDGGTWTDASKTLVVKTGTLNHPTPAKNLAGVEETTKGEVYFGFFIDHRGGNKYFLLKALNAMRSDFHGVQVKESSYSFNPSGTFNHLQAVDPDVTIAAK